MTYRDRPGNVEDEVVLAELHAKVVFTVVGPKNLFEDSRVRIISLYFVLDIFVCRGGPGCWPVRRRSAVHLHGWVSWLKIW